MTTFKRGCIQCGWFTLSSPVSDPTCPECGYHIAAGPGDDRASDEEIERAQEALRRFARGRPTTGS